MNTETRTKGSRRQTWPRIRKTLHNNGTLAWLVDARIAGKGERYFLKTKIEADTKAEQLRTARKNNGSSALAMPDKLRVEAMECGQRLAEVGATLTEAADYFIRHARPNAGARTVADVVAAFLSAKEEAGRRATYLSIQSYVLGYFAKTFGERPIHSIGHGEISDWMLAQPWTLRTRSNYRSDLANLFNFAVKRGCCASNPIDRLEKITLDDKPPGILTIKEAASLLTAAEQMGGGAMLPYVAIGLFAGLRASELAALDWSEVSIAERTIEVCAHKSKTRARRIVTMSENLAEWLAPYARTEGGIAPDGSLAFQWAQVRQASGIESWPKNAMRHSFASYYVAFHKNAPQTSLEMGHDNPNQLFASYRELVKPKDAARYWQLAPAHDEKVVRIEAAA